MASGIFAILDDIAALMDDVAVASKIAAQKTAGLLGDDLAVNAEKATGFLSSREIPVLWEITKGSLVNKIIIIPVVLILNYFLPIAITIILLIGGFYLAYEGVEKVIQYINSKRKKGSDDAKKNAVDNINDEGDEKAKIKSAITTDFILSVEIVIIALSSVLAKSLTVQILTVSVIAIVATVGVYGMVALIVRMDDAGYKLIKKSENQGYLATLGNILVNALPVVIKSLSIIGTIALLLVSGGIFVHNIDFLHHLLPTVPSIVKEFLVGIVAGLLAIPIFNLAKKAVAAFK
nr:DUF808 family protein [uncultured Flavobacterium sp.]